MIRFVCLIAEVCQEGGEGLAGWNGDIVWNTGLLALIFSTSPVADYK